MVVMLKLLRLLIIRWKIAVVEFTLSNCFEIEKLRIYLFFTQNLLYMIKCPLKHDACLIIIPLQPCHNEHIKWIPEKIQEGTSDDFFF